MGRIRCTLDHDVNQAALVARELKRRDLSAQDRQRLTAVQLGFDAANALDYIATSTGASVATIKRWFDKYREGGVAGLLKCSRGRGPKSRLHDEAKAALKEAVAKNGFRRAEDVRIWLEQKFNIKVSLASVYGYLGKSLRG